MDINGSILPNYKIYTQGYSKVVNVIGPSPGDLSRCVILAVYLLKYHRVEHLRLYATVKQKHVSVNMTSLCSHSKPLLNKVIMNIIINKESSPVQTKFN